jgi:hypothetical protein
MIDKTQKSEGKEKEKLTDIIKTEVEEKIEIENEDEMECLNPFAGKVEDLAAMEDLF